MAQNHLNSCPSLVSGIPEDCSCEREEDHYLKLATLSFGLFVFEIVGGLWSGSMALLSDGVHVLADGTENIINVIVSRRSRRSEREDHIRKIGGILSGMLLFVMGLWIIHEGWERFVFPQKVEGFMVLFAIAGLGVNIFQQWLHHRALPEHQNTQHFWQSWHLWSDIGASIAVIGGGLFMLYSEGLSRVDGVLSIGIGLLIVIVTGLKLLGIKVHHHGHTKGQNEHGHGHPRNHTH